MAGKEDKLRMSSTPFAIVLLFVSYYNSRGNLHVQSVLSDGIVETLSALKD
jgi:hypothetical protein